MLLCLFSLSAKAQTTYFWVGAAGASWGVASSWSLTSGGAGGAGTPSSNDNVVFDSNGNTNSTMGASYAIRSITINVTYSARITMGANNLTLSGTPSAGTSTFSGGNTNPISISTGTLNVNNGSNVLFTQARFDGIISLGASGDAGIITFGPPSASTITFNGAISGKAKSIIINKAVFNSSFSVEKTDLSNDWGTGGATFNNSFTLVNSGGGVLVLDSTLNTNYYGNVNLSTVNSGSLISIHSGSSGTFGSGTTLTINSTNSSGGISIGRSSTSLIGCSANLVIGASGFTSGRLLLSQFAYAPSTTLDITFGGASIIDLRNNTEFDVAVDSLRAPSILLNGCYFNTSKANLKKTGDNTDIGAGGNTFYVPTSITNSGNGDLITGDTNSDSFNSWGSILILVNKGSGAIRLADRYSGANTTFNMNIRLNSTSGKGIWFGHSGGRSQLQGNITIGASGFSAGILQLSGVTDNNNGFGTGQSYAIITTGTSGIRLGGTAAAGSGSATASVLQGGGSNISFTAPLLYLDGCTFNANNNTTTTLIQNGAAPLASNGLGSNIFQRGVTITNSGSGTLSTDGGNTFNSVGGTTTITNSGDGIISLENVSGNSTYNGDVTFTNTTTSATSKGKIHIANGGSTNFKSLIKVTQANTASDYNTDITQSSGIYFGESGGTSLFNGAAKTITVSGSFISGVLSLKGFTQQAPNATGQTLTLSSRGTLLLGTGTTFVSGVTFTGTAPALYLNGATFNGNALLTKSSNALSPDNGTGGCTFASTATIKSGNGTLRLATVSGDTFNGAVTFQQTNPGIIQPGYSAMCTVTGNITFDSNYASTITFGANGGGAQFTGTTTQTISKSGSASAAFGNLTMNSGAGGSLSLNTPVSVNGVGTFTNGIISYSLPTNILTFTDNASTSGGNSSSYVDNVVTKTGTITYPDFVFPVGYTSGGSHYYRSISISNLSGPATFTGQYFKSPYSSLTPIDNTLDRVSGCEYWILNRTSGTGNAYVTLSWKSSDCAGTYIGSLSDLRVARYDGTTWKEHGNGGTTGSTAQGTVKSSALIPSFSPFTIASATNLNPLPIKLGYFKAVDREREVELIWETLTEENSKTFSIGRSSDGEKFEKLFEIEAAGVSFEKNTYRMTDPTPFGGLSFYQLKEFDKDGSEQLSKVVSIIHDESDFLISPNPVKQGETVYLNVKADIRVINSIGKQVIELTSTNELNTNGLHPGLYVVSTETGKKVKLLVR